MLHLKTIAVAVLAISGLCQAAPIVDITIVADDTTLALGEETTLHVCAQVKPSHAGSSNGIFGWDVDLHASDMTIAGLLHTTLDRSGWGNDPLASSDGTLESWGIDAIYDGVEWDMSAGLGAPVQLFSIGIKALATGSATFTVAPDNTSVPTGVVLWDYSTGFDYTAASTTIAVVPEPASLSLLALAGVAILRRSKRS